MARVDFGHASSGQDGRGGGGAMRRTAPAWGLVQFGREVFCPCRPLEVMKSWQARTFAAAELAIIQYDPKVIVCAKTLGHKGDAYMAPRGHNTQTLK